MEGTPFEVELDTRAEEGRQQQQTHKGVLLEVEPSSSARAGPKESIKPSLGFGWMDQEVPATFRSARGSMKRESSRGALMKRNVFLNPRAKSSKWGFSEQRFGMWFAYQGKSKIQGSKKARSNEFGKGGTLFCTRGPSYSSLGLGGAPSTKGALRQEVHCHGGALGNY
ncbi:hypothetical protein ACE6H2_026468 [Prunus campanulata]